MSNNKIKTVIAAICCVLALALIAGLICVGVYQKPENPVLSNGQSNSGVQLEYGEQNNVELTAVSLTSDEFDEYGVSAQAESAYILTATVLPEDALNKTLIWSVSFVDASSEWATEKSVTDYVTVTPSSDTMTATVNCLKAFGERIKITATSQADSTKCATCYADYQQRITDISITVGDIIYYPLRGSYMYVNGRKLSECRIMPDISQYISAPCNMNIQKTSVYTIPCDDIPVSFELAPSDALVDYADSKGLNGNALTIYEKLITESGEGTLDGYFDKAWYLQAAGGTDNSTLASALINTIYAFESKTAYTLTFYIDDSTEPASTYNLVFDTSVVSEQTVIEEVSFDETELLF